MSGSLVRVNPDRERAKSILLTVGNNLGMIKKIYSAQFRSNVVREYYEIIRELMTAVLLLDGYKAVGEGSHRKLIGYLGNNYKQFTNANMVLINELRVMRNKIAYEGFMVKEGYLSMSEGDIKLIISKLACLVKEKLD